MKTVCRTFVLCSLLVPSTAWAQDSKKRIVSPEGTQAFRNILHQFDLQPIKTLEELAGKKPQETVLIVFGDTAILDDIRKQIGSLETFRKEGGAVLIASDRDDHGRLKEWNLRITGGVVTEDKSKAYKGIEDCPRAVGSQPNADAVFQGISQGLATNKPSVVRFGQSDFNLLAHFPTSSKLDGVRFLWPGPFLVGKDRALVMGGHSVFMNVLLAQSDNSNLVFAQNCVRWLKDGKRQYALFVEDGRIADEFDVGLTVLPPMRMPPTQVLNRLLRGLEDENIFNRLLDRIPRDRFVRVVLLLVTLLLLIYGSKRLLGARHRIEAAVPLLTPLPSPVPAVEMSLAAQRQQALLRGGNLQEPARDLARFFFAELAPVHHPGGDAPAYSASGNWLERRWLARHIPHLWQLAYGDPGRISRRQFARLPAILDRLTQIFRAGRLHWLGKDFS